MEGVRKDRGGLFREFPPFISCIYYFSKSGRVRRGKGKVQRGERRRAREKGRIKRTNIIQLLRLFHDSVDTLVRDRILALAIERIGSHLAREPVVFWVYTSIVEWF